jgi:hypothetical protein
MGTTLLACSKSGTSIIITDAFDASKTYDSSQIVFTISGITNPGSTQPTNPFNVTIQGGATTIITDASANLKITPTPASLTSAILTATSQLVGETTTLKLQITPNNTIPTGGAVQFDFGSVNSAAGIVLAGSTCSNGSAVLNVLASI